MLPAPAAVYAESAASGGVALLYGGAPRPLGALPLSHPPPGPPLPPPPPVRARLAPHASIALPCVQMSIDTAWRASVMLQAGVALAAAVSAAGAEQESSGGGGGGQALAFALATLAWVALATRVATLAAEHRVRTQSGAASDSAATADGAAAAAASAAAVTAAVGAASAAAAAWTALVAQSVVVAAVLVAGAGTGGVGSGGTLAATRLVASLVALGALLADLPASTAAAATATSGR